MNETQIELPAMAHEFFTEDVWSGDFEDFAAGWAGIGPSPEIEPAVVIHKVRADDGADGPELLDYFAFGGIDDAGNARVRTDT